MFEHGRGSWIVYAVVAVLVMGAGVRIFGGSDQASVPVQLSGPGADAVEDRAASDSGGFDEASTTADSSSLIVVHVAGAVRRPGVYSLGAEARVDAAVQEAGGFARGADPSAVNLAASLQDGQQVVVPKKGAAGALAASPATATGSESSGAVPPADDDGAGQKISLATATLEQLDAAVEGFGPTLSARVIEFRDQNGATTVEGLREVPGIGDVRYQALADALVP